MKLIWLPLAAEAWASPAHWTSQLFRLPPPKGMFSTVPVASVGLPPGDELLMMMSCGTDSLLLLLSPERHSPKAIVFERPSVMSRSERAGPPNWKAPLG